MTLERWTFARVDRAMWRVLVVANALAVGLLLGFAVIGLVVREHVVIVLGYLVAAGYCALLCLLSMWKLRRRA